MPSKQTLLKKPAKRDKGPVEYQLFTERKSPKAHITPAVLKQLHLRPIGTLAGFRVFLVDCEKVRNLCDPDFCMGSHYAHSRFIPHGQIWVSDVLHLTDLMPLLVHEAVETWWMTRRGWSYERAHDRATLFEKELRRQVTRGRIKPRTTGQAMELARKAATEILSRP